MTDTIETAKATKMKFDILNRFSGAVQFSAEIECKDDASTSVQLGLAVTVAVKADANLSCADLSGADLSRAYLSYANLRGADLRGSDLSYANLSGADLSRADLMGANLRGADPIGSDLSYANLSGADLSDANLSRANLSCADLSGAYLSDANLSCANLSCADLSGADLSHANLIDGGQRSDGHRFVGWIKEGVLQIRAGCRSLSIADARAHWDKTRGGTPLGDETFAILNHIETVARIRKLVMP